MAVGSVCLLPPLSSGGAQVALPYLRFHTPPGRQERLPAPGSHRT